MRRWLPTLLLVPFALLAACGTDPRANQWTDAAEAAAPTPSPTPTGPPVITLAFGGDVHFVETDGGVPNRTWALLDDPATAFGPVSELFHSADVSVINLETAVTTGGTPEPKTFLFRAPPVTYDAVREAGIDLVSLANNHALDYGRDGLADTMAHARERGVDVVGAGEDAAAAYAPWVREIDGVRIAVLGFNQVWELWESWRALDDRSGIAYAMDTDRALAAVRSTVETADFVAVYMHWGLELEGHQCPTEEMQNFAGMLADEGVDLIVGTHAHHLLGDGWLGDTYVQYGLGNFLWWRDDRFSNDTGVLWVTLRGSEIESVELLPAMISRETGQPIPVSGEEADRILRDYEALRDCTGLAAERGN
jgi:poly-gamma-glutamate capsule biosynthesis protein CapA/YwtB (metallophosphatase superfamily)